MKRDMHLFEIVRLDTGPKRTIGRLLGGEIGNFFIRVTAVLTIVAFPPNSIWATGQDDPECSSPRMGPSTLGVCGKGLRIYLPAHQPRHTVGP